MSAWHSWPSRAGPYTARGPRIQWLHSYVTGNKFYCVCLAPHEGSIREHRGAGVPADRVRRGFGTPSLSEF